MGDGRRFHSRVIDAPGVPTSEDVGHPRWGEGAGSGSVAGGGDRGGEGRGVDGEVVVARLAGAARRCVASNGAVSEAAGAREHEVARIRVRGRKELEDRRAGRRVRQVRERGAVGRDDRRRAGEGGDLRIEREALHRDFGESGAREDRPELRFIRDLAAAAARDIEAARRGGDGCASGRGERLADEPRGARDGLADLAGGGCDEKPVADDMRAAAHRVDPPAVDARPREEFERDGNRGLGDDPAVGLRKARLAQEADARQDVVDPVVEVAVADRADEGARSPEAPRRERERARGERAVLGRRHAPVRRDIDEDARVGRDRRAGEAEDATIGNLGGEGAESGGLGDEGGGDLVGAVAWAEREALGTALAARAEIDGGPALARAEGGRRALRADRQVEEGVLHAGRQETADLRPVREHATAEGAGRRWHRRSLRARVRRMRRARVALGAIRVRRWVRPRRARADLRCAADRLRDSDTLRAVRPPS